MGGFEPPTSRLTADCSAVELHWNVYIIAYLTFFVKYQFYDATEYKKCNNKNEGQIAPPQPYYSTTYSYCQWGNHPISGSLYRT